MGYLQPLSHNIFLCWNGGGTITELGSLSTKQFFLWGDNSVGMFRTKTVFFSFLDGGATKEQSAQYFFWEGDATIWLVSPGRRLPPYVLLNDNNTIWKKK